MPRELLMEGIDLVENIVRVLAAVAEALDLGGGGFDHSGATQRCLRSLRPKLMPRPQIRLELC